MKSFNQKLYESCPALAALEAYIQQEAVVWDRQKRQDQSPLPQAPSPPAKRNAPPRQQEDDEILDALPVSNSPYGTTTIDTSDVAYDPRRPLYKAKEMPPATPRVPAPAPSPKPKVSATPPPLPDNTAPTPKAPATPPPLPDKMQLHQGTGLKMLRSAAARMGRDYELGLENLIKRDPSIIEFMIKGIESGDYKIPEINQFVSKLAKYATMKPRNNIADKAPPDNNNIRKGLRILKNRASNLGQEYVSALDNLSKNKNAEIDNAIEKSENYKWDVAEIDEFLQNLLAQHVESGRISPKEEHLLNMVSDYLGQKYLDLAADMKKNYNNEYQKLINHGNKNYNKNTYLQTIKTILDNHQSYVNNRKSRPMGA